eukprot:scaffold20328_cov116-Isochrysis_galbana.AAC.11
MCVYKCSSAGWWYRGKQGRLAEAEPAGQRWRSDLALHWPLRILFWCWRSKSDARSVAPSLLARSRHERPGLVLYVELDAFWPSAGLGHVGRVRPEQRLLQVRLWLAPRLEAICRQVELPGLGRPLTLEFVLGHWGLTLSTGRQERAASLGRASGQQRRHVPRCSAMARSSAGAFCTHLVEAKQL